MTDPGAISGPLAFLAGGGEMGERLRSFDWARTPLGPPAAWPQSLKTAVSLCLNSRFPIVLWWGSDLRLLYNDAWRPVLGQSKHPGALGAPGEHVWPEIWDIIGPMLRGVLDTGRATWQDDQLLVLDRNGYLEEAYFTYSYSPIADERGGVGGVFSAVHETTQKVLEKRRLRTLRDLAARTNDARGAADACARVAATIGENPLDIPYALLYLVEGDAARLKGSAGDVAEPLRPPAVPLADGSPAPWPIAPVVRERKPVRVSVGDTPGLPAGAWGQRPREAMVLPVTSPTGGLSAVLVAGVNPHRDLDEAYQTFFDLVASEVGTTISNARAYEEERRRAEALAELDRAKTAFFSNVSHEFRTPLTLMLGPVEDMLDKSFTDLTPASRGQLEVVHRNSLRLLKLVNTMLDFSRIEAGRIQANYEPVDLAPLTADLASSFRSACERAGLRLDIHCPPLPPGEPAYIDRDMWEKVVLNLLSNAFKFTLEGGIDVRLDATAAEATLSVADTGVGIPPGEMPRIFERFHRVHNARGRTHEGTGIGLALVQELVRLHGGRVAAHSEPGRGSRFTVTIPRGRAHLDPARIQAGSALAPTRTGAHAFVEEALRWLPQDGPDAERQWVRALPAPATVAPAAGTPAGEPRARILWADDNADMRDYVARLLGERFDVEAVPDGQAALEAARARRPDAVLSDVMMPRLDGFGLLRALRADPALADVPVILLSARAGEEARIEGVEAGADDYLTKPFSARELLARVDSHIRMARFRRDAAAALSRTEARTSAIVESSLDAIISMDHEGRIVEFNPAAERIFGHTRDQALGREMASLIIPPALRERHRQGLARFKATGEGPILNRRIELTGLRASGEEFPVELTVTVIRDGGPPLFTGYLRDITDRKHAERRLLTQAAATTILSESADLPTAAARLLGTICDHLQWEVGALFLVEGERLRCAQVRRCSERAFPRFEAATRERVFRPGEGLPGRVWESRIPVWISDVVRDGNFPRAPIAAAEGLHGALAFPIILGGHVLGVMEFFSREVREPDAGLLDMMRVIGSQVGQFVERRRAEDALRASEERYRAVVESMAEMLCRFRPDGTILFVNAAYAAARGATAAALAGRNLWDFITEEDRPAVRALLGRLTPDHPEVSIENRFETTQGPRWTLWTNRALGFDDDGRPVEVQSSGIDITARKQAEEALRRSEERLRLALRGASAGVWGLDLGTGQTFWSEEFLPLFGFDASTPRTLERRLAAVHLDDRARVEAEFRARLGPPETEFRQEFRILHPRRGVRWIMDMGRIQRDAAGRALRFDGISLDITDRKQAEEALRESIQALQRINLELERFVSISSHDLKEPLRGMAHLASFMLEDEPGLTAQGRQRLERIRQLAERLTSMINGLLEYARSGGKRLSEPCDLGEIARRAIDKLAETIRRENAEVSVAPGLPVVEGDPVLLERAFANLIANAIKYNRSPVKRVEIGLEGDAVFVRDNGVGIDPRHHDRVFRMFSRIPGAPGDPHDGTGLGLATVMSIVESHGGRIQLRSQPGAGSVFLLRFADGPGHPSRRRDAAPTLPDPPPAGRAPEGLTPTPARPPRSSSA